MSFHYIIATWNGYHKREHLNPPPECILKIHLRRILKYASIISKITIMQAESDNYYPAYYDIQSIVDESPIPIEQVLCENYGFSSGQWLKAVELDRIENKHYDYYLFVEDDYCPNMQNFDQILTEVYATQCETRNKGILCSVMQRKHTQWPLHYEGLIFMSSYTIQLLFDNPKWENNPLKWLDNMNEQTAPGYEWSNIRNSYIGAYYQLAISHLFTLSDIPHYQYISKRIQKNDGTFISIQFPYWSDIRNKIIIYDEHENEHSNITPEIVKNSLIIPVQLYNYHHPPPKELPIIVFIIGMHRSGTSVLTNCLIQNGFSIGKTQNADRNWQNPNGYFENDAFTRFHNQLLAFNNSSWHTITPEPIKWTDDHVSEYKQLLEREFCEKERLCVIKDPRLTFFVPFLQQVCHHWATPYFLFLDRAKEECTHSLVRAQTPTISTPQAELLYDKTMALYDPFIHLKLNHRDILLNHVQVLKCIEQFIHVPLSKNTTPTIDLNLYRSKK